MHLFRGKCLNSKIFDGATRKLRQRTKLEKINYITRKYHGESIHSDGTALIINDSERVNQAEKVTRRYIRNIKEGKQNKAIFGAEASYSNAVKILMSQTKLKGASLVSTSKLPWVASEYAAGLSGGAAGGDRKTEYGYFRDGKPFNRIMGLVLSCRCH